MSSSTALSILHYQYDGFRLTPLLWEGQLEGIDMYVPACATDHVYPEIDTTSRTRLGKRVEQFVLHDLALEEHTAVLAANIQVSKDKVTIGELDCLVRQLETDIHLEIVYKFYLYDPSITTERYRWIGPNRKDSLVLKLNKLKEKQLPLLYRPETGPLLQAMDMRTYTIAQMVYFKAQLFVPLDYPIATITHINKECIKGFYIREDDLSQFDDCVFYIPCKMDWLADPHPAVSWISSKAFKTEVTKLLFARLSPMCWMKSPDGKMMKLFVVWWDCG